MTFCPLEETEILKKLKKSYIWMILSRICNHITESSYATKITLKYTTQKGNNESQTSEREIAPTRLGLAGPTVPPQNVIFEKRQMRSNGEP